MISTAVATSYFQLQSNIALVKLAKKNSGSAPRLIKIERGPCRTCNSSAIPVSSAQIQVQIFALLLAQVEKEVMVNRHQLAINRKESFYYPISIKKFSIFKIINLTPSSFRHIIRASTRYCCFMLAELKRPHSSECGLKPGFFLY